ncbi:WD40/YVTN/BNR-like repeat-containing protein [Noviherbaspirillum sedimenti]|uniref:Glycosyl hydrolase n=1 Tax=Noviherbaspirillum sedimenti TaxID=2320865 RepID=A0A3A3G2J9_9BURK|nr:YCF48-related protein [Noviherbaspirillum sedimenti]RJG02687.1 glycosyl hydrolase [Noviherbaspirillum sedimenti]
MKVSGIKTALGCVLFVGFVASAAADFKDPLERVSTLTPLAQRGRLLAVAQAGSNLVAVGPRGHILISRDAGQSWQQVQAPVSSDLVNVRFLNSKTGWAVGHDGIILNTTDGGLSWKKQFDGNQAAEIIRRHYGNLKASTKKIDGIADILRMGDEGADKPFFDILFVDDNEGFAVGAFNLAFHTKDGGKSWAPIIDRTGNPKGFHLYALAVSDGVLFLVGEQGLLRRWDRASERFVEMDSPYSGSYFGAVGDDKVLIVFGMRGNAFRSSDHGQSWTKLSVGALASITGASLLADILLISTQDGKLLISGDRGELFSEVTIATPMPSYFGVVRMSDEKAALVGSNGPAVVSIKHKYLKVVR